MVFLMLFPHKGKQQKACKQIQDHYQKQQEAFPSDRRSIQTGSKNAAKEHWHGEEGVADPEFIADHIPCILHQPALFRLLQHLIIHIHDFGKAELFIIQVKRQGIPVQVLLHPLPQHLKNPYTNCQENHAEKQRYQIPPLFQASYQLCGKIHAKPGGCHVWKDLQNLKIKKLFIPSFGGSHIVEHVAGHFVFYAVLFFPVFHTVLSLP